MKNEKMKYVLLQSWFTGKHRHEEYLECLERNIQNEYIKSIHLCCTNGDVPSISSDKIKIVHVDEIPTFREFFKYSNNNLKNEICMISNLDIYFDESLKDIEAKLANDDIAISLSRWNVDGDRNLVDHQPPYSHDVWIYKSPTKKALERANIDFSIGIPGCDNRIGYELCSVGYRLINPALTIKAMHLHVISYRGSRSSDGNGNRLKGNYLKEVPIIK